MRPPLKVWQIVLAESGDEDEDEKYKEQCVYEFFQRKV